MRSPIWNGLLHFLQQRHPTLAKRIASEIVKRARMISDYSEIGHSVSNGIYRQLGMPVLNATYIFRDSIRPDHVRMLRVFHSREQRET